MGNCHRVGGTGSGRSGVAAVVSLVSPAPKRSVAAVVVGFPPGYFALVMATGIIATGADQQGYRVVAEVLFVIAAVSYVVLVARSLARVALVPREVLGDLTSHARGFAFLTAVAATNVLGGSAALIHGWWSTAWVMWWIGIALWAPLLYATLFAVVLRGDKPGLEAGINGTWFLLTVSTESVAVLGALLFNHHRSEPLAFFVLATFTLGVVLYLIIMTMVFLRWTFQELEPTEADPPAWIAAGAVAITVLAGSTILLDADASAQLRRVAPFVEGVVVLAWATATFWFPLMVAIGVWRHLIRRVPLRYYPSLWTMVFPLGMYGVATFRMTRALDLEFLQWLPSLTFAVALSAWAATALGLVVAVTAGVLKRPEG